MEASPSSAPAASPSAVVHSGSVPAVAEGHVAPGGAEAGDTASGDATSGDTAAQTAEEKVFSFSNEAVAYATQRLAKRGTPNAAVRLGVKGGGCSGFSYAIEFSDDPPRSRDTVYDFGTVRFYVDKKSLVFLTGSTLDYEKTLMFQGFKFVNPREATRCGCGHSFTVK